MARQSLEGAKPLFSSPQKRLCSDMQVEYLYYDVKSLTEHHYFTVGMNTQVKATRAIQHVNTFQDYLKLIPIESI